MRIKHITFHEAERAPWVRSQEQWLAASVGASGLSAAWGSEHKGAARAAFLWESEASLQGFMERDHDRALAEAGTVGRHAILYLDVLEREGTLDGATHMAESMAWVRDGGVDAWLADRRLWAEATRAADGYRGTLVARGRHAFLVTTFWADTAAHERYVGEAVPRVRAATDEGHTVRLVRFDAALTPSLVHGTL